MKYICLDCRESKKIKRGKVIMAMFLTLREAQEHARFANHNLVGIDKTGKILSAIRYGVFGYRTKVGNKLPPFLVQYKDSEE